VGATKQKYTISDLTEDEKDDESQISSKNLLMSDNLLVDDRPPFQFP
jgi:hypothetical protein